MERIIGLDLSITATGIAWEDGTTDCIHPTEKGDRRLTELRTRLGLNSPAAWAGITLAVIEDLPTHAHAAGITGMVHGMVRVELIHRSVPYTLVPPAVLKVYATGRGNATKPDLRMELYKRAGLDLADDNECDAAWLRLLGHDLCGQPLLQLPQTHRRALDKVDLP